MLATMHTDRRATSFPFRLKTLTAIVLTTLAVCNADAAGLGKLTVLSGLGQPLHAEIDLTSVTPEEVASLAPKLASAEAFRQANIDFHPALLGLRFAVEQRSGRYLIRVTSSQPMNEPFVDMMLELGAANGRLVREYTFLLDPAEMRTAQSPQVAAPIVLQPAPTARREVTAAVQQPQIAAPVSVPPVAVAPVRPPVAAPAPATVPAPAPVVQYRPAPPPPTQARASSAATTSGKQLEIRRGDTLARVARDNLPGGVSLDQMLVALYRANPDAFIGANMNRLRAGQILTVPDAGVISQTPASQARTEVQAQSADFNEYRNKLAGQVAGSDARKPVESTQSASGKITAKVAEPSTAASEARDKLKLSKARTADDKSAATRDTEDRIASEKALAESNARVKELERNVGDLQKLLEVKNRDLAERQKTAEADKGKSASGAAAAVKPVDANASKPADSAAAKSTSVTSSTSSTTVSTVTPPARTTAGDTAVTKPAPKPAIIAKPAPEPESLFDNPLVLPGAGLLLAALAALGLFAARRKRRTNIELDYSREPGLKTNSMFGATGGQKVDTNNSEFNSSFAPTTGNLSGSEVDPIAEADVYIAYGRDAQAEEILKEALRANPDRHAVRVRLLEIYANRNDLVSFEPLAAELQRMTGGKGEEWEQVAALAASLDPKAPPGSGKTRYTKFAGKVAPANNELDERAGTRHVEAMASTGEADKLSDKSAVPAATAAPDVVVPPAALAAPLIVAAAAGLVSAHGPSEDDRTQMVAPPAAAPIEPAPVEPVLPESAPIEPAPVRTLETLDFNTGRLDARPEFAATPAGEPAPLASKMEEINFDFLDGPAGGQDFALDAHADKPAVEAPAAGAPSAGAPSAGAPSAGAPVAGAPAAGAPAAGAPAALEDEFALMEADFAKFEVPGKDRAKPVDPAPAPTDFDLSDISLELNPQDAAPVTETVFPTPFEFDDLAFDSPAPPVSSAVIAATDAEMSTKLDLAVAYEEIGDKEGARELLEEVIVGGSVDQIAKARALLKNLA